MDARRAFVSSLFGILGERSPIVGVAIVYSRISLKNISDRVYSDRDTFFPSEHFVNETLRKAITSGGRVRHRNIVV
ncbi:hypothetical protein VB711_22680 [Cronbergia sp. UHCC 0137]|uniref:hypothetical protein n=1 Tax=Cronbergia sp. UHCC 0137 TaxID=3110239 RepID=UPI002B1EB478|nr:hypothetical protein [Cronbergia sp. UHCC 0137]MEA5620624.1 hypothetical protein [Cronbergia sp. UHCC 0137]